MPDRPNESASEEQLAEQHVNVTPNIATEDDEAEVLESLGYRLNLETGVYEGGDPDGDE